MSNESSPELESSIKHRSLYKFTTPPWKETYRQKCHERLQNSRQRLFNKFRGLAIETESFQKDAMEQKIKQIMEEEWTKMHNSSISNEYFEDTDDFNSLLSFMDTVQKELLEEEERIIREYEEVLEIEESSVQEIVKTLETNCVICPICQNRIVCPWKI
ncbi:RPA-interacting protein A-like [Centruroides vittatus]|uniref:RPA-interacting protein A-like n=1 Tax=Centruroides vittatus TaxID=120091 RepID=UPI003510A8AF